MLHTRKTQYVNAEKKRYLSKKGMNTGVRVVMKKKKRTIDEILSCGKCCKNYPYCCFSCSKPVFLKPLKTLDVVSNGNGKITNNL